MGKRITDYKLYGFENQDLLEMDPDPRVVLLNGYRGRRNVLLRAVCTVAMAVENREDEAGRERSSAFTHLILL